METKRKSWIWLGSRAALLLVGIIWGSSLVVVKSSAELIQPNLLIASRFSLACIVLSIIFFKKFKKLDRDSLISGAIIGACLFAAYWLSRSPCPGKAHSFPPSTACLCRLYSG